MKVKVADGATASGNCIKGNSIKNHDQEGEGVGLWADVIPRVTELIIKEL